MRTILAGVILSVILAGCVPVSHSTSRRFEARVPKGRLEILINLPDGAWMLNADVYVDGKFIGNPPNGPMDIILESGRHKIRVETAGYKPYEKTVTILGDPNPLQVLNISLEKQ